MKSDRKAKADINPEKLKKHKVNRRGASKPNGQHREQRNSRSRGPAAKPVPELEEMLKPEREELIASRQRLLATYEHAPIGIVECSPEGRYLRVNEEFCRLTGYSSEELLARTIQQLIHEADYPVENRLYQQLLSGEVPSYKMEKRYIRKEGEIIWVEITRSLIRDEDGNPLYTVGTILDISERKRSERALIEIARQQAALYKLADELHRTNSLEALYAAALDAILDALQCDRASILLFDDAGIMRFVAWRGLSDAYRRATDGHSPWKQDIKDPEPICLEDVATGALDEGLRAVIETEGIAALAFIPLVFGGKLIGKFMIYFNSPHVFTTNQKDLALTIGRQLAFGIDRRQADAKLRESEQRFRVLADGAPVMIWVNDADARCEYVNREYLDFFGKRLEEVQGFGWQPSLHPDDSDAYVESYLNAFRARTPFRSQTRILHHTGEYRWADVYALPRYAPGGEFLGYIGICHDINAHKRAEEALRQSEERFRALVSQATAGIAESDVDGRLTFVNPSFSEMLGYSAPELVGKTIWELTHNEDLDENNRLFERMRTRGDAYQFQKRFIRRDGSLLWANVSVSPKRDVDGSYIGGVGIVIDISRQKQAEEKLRESEERYRLVVESQSEMLCRFRPDGTILFANSAYARARGTTPEELVSHNFWEFIAEDDRAGVRAMLDSLTPEKPEIRIENRFETTEGERWTLWTNRALKFAPNGRLVEAQSSGIDITDRKRSEEAVRESEERLRLATEAAQMYTWELDIPSRTYTVSDNIAAVMGFSADLLPERPDEVMQRFSPPEDVRHATEAVQKAMEARSDVRGLQYRVIHPETGETLWVEVNAKTIFDVDGNPVRMYGVAQNISEARRREDEVRRLNAELQAQLDEMNSLLEILPTGVLIGNHDCSEITGNPAAYKMLGLMPGINLSFTSPETELPADIRMFVNHEEILADEAPMQQVARGGTALYDQEHELVLPGDVHKYIHANIVPLFDESGGVRKVIATYTDFTARKRAEEALKAKEAELEEVLNETPFMLTRCTRDYRYRFVSRAYAELLGRTPEEMTGKSIRNVIGREGFNTLQPYIERVLGGERVEFETQVVFQGVGKPWLHVVYTPDRDPDGNVNGWFASIVDVTERKRAEEALQESEGLYRAIARSIPGGGVYVLDKNLRYLVAEGPVTEAFGYTRDQIEDHTVAEVLSGDVRTRFEQNIQRVFEGEKLSTEVEHAGRVYWSQYAPLVDAMGQAIVITMDITERKRAEEAWRESRERYRNLFDSVPVAVYTCDAQGLIEEYNQRAIELWGREPAKNDPNEKYCGSFKIYYPDGRFMPHEACPMSRVLHGETLEPHELEILVERPDGARRNIIAHPVAMRNERGEIVAAINCLYDITERKQAEEALRAHAERQQFLVNLDDTLRPLTDAIEIQAGATRVIGQHLGAARTFYAEIEPDGQHAVIHRDYHDGVAALSGRYRVEDFGPALIGEMRAGRTLVVVNTDSEPSLSVEERAAFAALEIGAAVGVPLIKGKQWVACLIVHHQEAHAWTQLEISLIEETAARTWDAVERARAESALRVSKERLQLALDASGMGTFVWYPAEDRAESDERMLALFGLTMDGKLSLADALATMIHPDDGPGYAEAVAHAIDPAGSGQLREDIRVFYPDGSLHWVAVTGQTLFEGDPPHAARMNGIAHEITARKRAEEALRESEERLRALINQATAGIVREDVDGTLLFVNEAFCQMLGYAESELLGRKIWEFTHNEDLAENRRLFDRMMTEGTPFQLEKRLLRPDGSVIWVNVSVSPVMDAHGRPQSVVAVEVDITGRKQAEEALQQLNLQLESRVQKRTAKLQSVNQALRESEAATRTILDTSPDAIVIADKSGRIVRVNAQIKTLFGYRPEDVIGQPFDMLVSDRFRGWYSGQQGTAGAYTPSYPNSLGIDVFGRRRDATEFPVDVKLTPISGVTDWDVMITLRDTTERKQMADALYQSRERLRMLSRRLVEVQEEERRTIARELHDRVGQTLAALNINLIILGSQMSPDSLQRIGTRLDDSMKLVAEAVALVRDVMTDLRPAVLDDYGLEAALQSHIDAYASRHNIKVTFDHPAQQIPRLESGLEMTLLRIAQEALTNVAKHAQADQVGVALRLVDQAVSLTVEDNGIGIEHGTNGKPQSHGLKIMQERAEAFGGHVEVESASGKGTRIVARIPLEQHVLDGAQEKKVK